MKVNIAIEGDGRRSLEEGKIGRGGENDLGECGEIRLGDLATGDANPLGKAGEMRRRVQAHAIPGGAKDRVQHGGHRAFAVGAGDVHGGEALVRVPEVPQREHYALELEIHATGRLEAVQ
jgi:hypothetical protein